jgi:tRNA pseudouridine55 synthase
MPLPFKVSTDKPFDEISLEEFQEGKVLLVDKPLEWSSFQAVNKIKYHIQKKFNIKKKQIKIGHAGTLDPLATGLLIVCTGKQTKSITEYQDQYKIYSGTFHLGATTPSYDLETEVNETFPVEHITEELINDTLEHFIGEVEQVPPVFSAIKVDGKRAYKKARAGEEVVIPKRIVSIYDFEITDIDLPSVNFKVKCSKGTYIRTLANDFGSKLNSGAYLSALRREAIGEFTV